jgi:hypothetical protein
MVGLRDMFGFMSFVCLTGLASTTAATSDPAELSLALLERAPKVLVDAGREPLLWADARGLHARSLADTLRGVLQSKGCRAPRAGVATTAVAAKVAALHGREPITVVPAQGDREWLAPFPVAVLDPEPDLANLLEGTGIECCGELAALDQASVELRFGAAGVALWRLARADDRRLLFGPPPPPLPHASLEWTDYVLRDPERLLFVINRLAGNVTTSLRELGRGARTFTLVFTLDRGGTVEHQLHPSRPNADQRSWMRLIRDELEQVRLPDAVSGVALRVDAVLPSASIQGDLLDRGFASAKVAEAALARVLDERARLLAPLNNRHPLLRRRTVWREEPATIVWRRADLSGKDLEPRLALHHLPEPQTIVVETEASRGFRAPLRYRDSEGWHELLVARGPECVSGGEWEDPFAVELYSCIRIDGELVQLARDAGSNTWTLEGSWR